MPISVETANIFQRILDPLDGHLSAEVARFIKSIDFSDADQDRFTVLSEKAQDNSLTEDEFDELDAFLQVDRILSILHLKADRSLDGAHG